MATGAHATLQARTHQSAGNGGGGDVEDVLKRLGAVEATVSDIKAEVTGLSATVAHLATRSELAQLRTELAQVESSLIKWIVGTSLAAVSMAFVIARYVTP